MNANYRRLFLVSRNNLSYRTEIVNLHLLLPGALLNSDLSKHENVRQQRCTSFSSGSGVWSEQPISDYDVSGSSVNHCVASLSPW
jgi:hypothetical protein